MLQLSGDWLLFVKEDSIFTTDFYTLCNEKIENYLILKISSLWEILNMNRAIPFCSIKLLEWFLCHLEPWPQFLCGKINGFYFFYFFIIKQVLNLLNTRTLFQNTVYPCSSIGVIRSDVAKHSPLWGGSFSFKVSHLISASITVIWVLLSECKQRWQPA